MSSSQKKRMFNVPYEFCRYVVKFGLFREASVYLMLKYICDGQIEITPAVLNNISHTLRVSQRTVNRALEWLRNNNWILKEYDKVYRIISFNKLYFTIRLGKSKIGAIWDDPEFRDTKAFAITACATKISHIQNRKKRASAMGIDAQTILPVWVKKVLMFSKKKDIDLERNYLSKSFFASLLEIPLTTAYDYLNYAVKSGYLIKKRHYVRSRLCVSEARLAREYATHCGGKNVVVNKDKVEVLLPNSFESGLVVRKRSVLRRLEKKFGL